MFLLTRENGRARGFSSRRPTTRPSPRARRASRRRWAAAAATRARRCYSSRRARRSSRHRRGRGDRYDRRRRAARAAALKAEAAATPAARAQAKPSLPPLHSSDTDIVERPHLVWVVLDDVGYNDVGYASSGPRARDAVPRRPLDRRHPLRAFVRPARVHAEPRGDADGQVSDPPAAPALAGRPDRAVGLPTQEVLLPPDLRALGYKNVMIGKWHLGHFNNASTPRSRGFDHFYGFYSGGVDYFTHVSEESCD